MPGQRLGLQLKAIDPAPLSAVVSEEPDARFHNYTPRERFVARMSSSAAQAGHESGAVAIAWSIRSGTSKGRIAACLPLWSETDDTS